MTQRTKLEIQVEEERAGKRQRMRESKRASMQAIQRERGREIERERERSPESLTIKSACGREFTKERENGIRRGKSRG